MRAIQKDTFREIRRTLGRFFSIFLICGIGAAFFSGIRAASPDMRLAADTYYDEQNLMDVRLLSTVGFEQEDLDLIAQVEGVEGIRAGYTVDVLASVNEKNLVAKVYSMTPDPEQGTENDINRPLLLEGRLPQAENECLADARLVSIGVSIGDTIRVSSGTENEISDTLKDDAFTVVGIANSPLYNGTSRDSATIGNGTVSGFLMVPETAFCLDRYTEVTLTVAGAKAMMSYDEVYDTTVEPVTAALETLGEQRTKDWETDVIQKAKEELADAEQAYQDGKDTAEREFANAQKTIDDGKKELSANRKTLEDTQKTLSDSRKEWQEGVAAFVAQLDPSYTELSQAEGWISEKQAQYEQAKEQYEQSKPFLTPEQDAEARAKLAALQGAIDQASQGMAALQSAERQIEDGERQLSEGQAQLSAGEKQLEDAQRTLDREKANTNQELEDAWQEILDARQEIDDLPDCEWYVLDRNTNIGFVEYGFAAERMQAIANVFPAFFFLVAALVCLTTMTRMVDEQRNNMGVCKALGYGKGTIAAKYLFYALSASLLGSLLGVIIGMQFFPKVIFDAYNSIYNVPTLYTPMYADLASMSIAMAVGTTFLATLWASLSSLSHKPSDLMRPKAPKIGKRILLERVHFLWKRMSFSGKVTARNLFRYKKRLCMTVLGIAGCTALLLIGFGIRDSISTIATLQFDDLYQYQDIVTMKDNLPQAEIDSCRAGVQAQPGVQDTAVMYVKSTQTRGQNGDGTEVDAYITVPQQSEAMSQWIRLRDVETKDPLSLKAGGAVITDKMAETLGLAPGDMLEIKTDDGWRQIPVAAVAEHYLNHYVYLCQDDYEQVFGEPPAYNQLYVKTDSTDNAYEESLRAGILELENITQVASNTATIQAFQDTVDNMMTVVIVLILSAGLLAFVVLYNLTNINIGERVREIATLKVLGFTRREVDLYVFRENLWLSLLGILVGFVFGKYLHLYIMNSVEVEMIRFGRQILPVSYLLAAVLTLAFTLIVSVVMSRKLRKVDMVESLKSVE